MADLMPAATEAQPPTPLTAVSLFAGVGGIDLALERAGVKVTAAVEIDPAARGVLADRFPETTLFDDVTKVTADELRATGFVPERGIIAAGWPCQGNSVAGSRGGMADPRSGLWRHVVRLLAETRTRWFLGENVPGLLSVNDGDDFGVVVHDLATLGYGGASRVLDAQFFGVPQRRRRVFFVGCLGDQRRPIQVLAEPEGSSRHHPPSRPPGSRIAPTLEAGANKTGGTRPPGSTVDTAESLVVVETASTLQGGGKRGRRIGAESAAGGHLVVQPVALRGRPEGAELEVGQDGDPSHTLRTPGGGSSHAMIAFSHTAGIDCQASESITPTMKAGHDTMPSVQNGPVVRRLTPRECERLQGFPDDWTATSNGKPQADSARYRQMGNAVAVPCVEWIARRMVEVA